MSWAPPLSVDGDTHTIEQNQTGLLCTVTHQDFYCLFHALLVSRGALRCSREQCSPTDALLLLWSDCCLGQQLLPSKSLSSLQLPPIPAMWTCHQEWGEIIVSLHKASLRWPKFIAYLRDSEASFPTGNNLVPLVMQNIHEAMGFVLADQVRDVWGERRVGGKTNAIS